MDYQELNDDEKILFLVKQNKRLRIEENHNVKFVRVSEIAKILNITDIQIMEQVKDFGLDSVTSINSTINSNVVQSFIKFIAENINIEVI
jgi:uncharacterized protein YkvS